MIDFTEYIDPEVAKVAVLLIDTVAMMMCFILTLMSAMSTNNGSWPDFIWYVVFIVLTNFYAKQVRKDFREIS